MRLIVVCALLSLNITASAADESVVPSADDWYKSEYAPLYLDKPSDKLDELMEHFAETMHIHGGDSGGEVVNGREWLGRALQEWKIEGWLRSEIAEIDSDQRDRRDRLGPTDAARSHIQGQVARLLLRRKRGLRMRVVPGRF